MIEVTKIDGSTMYLNEEIIERVENTLTGQCAVYLIHGGHIVVSHDSPTVAEKIREEKIAQLRRVYGVEDSPKTRNPRLRKILTVQPGEV